VTDHRSAPARPRPLITEVIDKAGPVLFVDDWIGSLSSRDLALLERQGPQRGAEPNEQVIEPCPSPHRVDLDRALGRFHRAGAQRSRVLEWLYQGKIIIDSRGTLAIDDSKLAAALAAVPASGLQQVAQAAETARGRGRPPDLMLSIAAKMKVMLDSGSVTKSELLAMKQEQMVDQFGGARKTCVDARELAVAEHDAISNN